MSWYLAAITAVLTGVLALLHAGGQKLTLRHAAGAAAGLAVCGRCTPATPPWPWRWPASPSGVRARQLTAGPSGQGRPR